MPWHSYKHFDVVVSLKKLWSLEAAVLAKEMASRYWSSSITEEGFVLEEMVCDHSDTTLPLALSWKEERE